MGNLPAYWKATRHPWPCLLFVLPLLLAYEGCVLGLGGAQPQALRNGADNWLRVGLGNVGLNYGWLPPAALVFLFWCWARLRHDDRPADLTGVLTGMALESVAYALGLWGVSRALPVLLARMGVGLPMAAAEQGTLRLVSYLGAGIYEEALFRQCLYAGAVWGMRWAKVPLFLSCVLAAAGSAALFSAAHHVGPYGQPYNHYVFLFRVLAGLYFALLFQLRGFGVAVGAHACYNVAVSVGAA